MINIMFPNWSLNLAVKLNVCFSNMVDDNKKETVKIRSKTIEGQDVFNTIDQYYNLRSFTIFNVQSEKWFFFPFFGWNLWRPDLWQFWAWQSPEVWMKINDLYFFWNQILLCQSFFSTLPNLWKKRMKWGFNDFLCSFASKSWVSP